MNNIPINKNGEITTIEPGLPEKEWKKIIPALNAKINITPPATSHFHATINIANAINTGILFIRKLSILVPKESFPLNTSIENNNIKRIAIIASARGIQYKIFDNIFKSVLLKYNKKICRFLMNLKTLFVTIHVKITLLSPNSNFLYLLIIENHE